MRSIARGGSLVIARRTWCSSKQKSNFFFFFANFFAAFFFFFFFQRDWVCAQNYALWANVELEITTRSRVQERSISPLKFLVFVAILFVVHFVLRACCGKVALFVTAGVALAMAFGKCKNSRRCHQQRRVCEARCVEVQQPVQQSVQQSVAQQSVAQQQQNVQFAEQLRVLFDLGFNDVLKNVEQLKATNGDLNLAVQGLLMKQN
jgi:hypothetical protein